MIKPFVTLLFLPLLFFYSAHAALGKKSALKSQQKAGLRVGHQMFEQRANSINVREHVRSDGIVYGIAWDGIAPPDLKPLLGDYADEYKKLNQLAPRVLGKRARQLKSSRLVVERWGHMRNLRGRIYDPNLLLDGVKPDEIK